MLTQEPLFNDTIFRYDLMHDLFVDLQNERTLVDDQLAVRLVATLGIKGPNFLTCDQAFHGDNILSVAYAPGPRGALLRGLGVGCQLNVAPRVVCTLHPGGLGRVDLTARVERAMPRPRPQTSIVLSLPPPNSFPISHP